jgi:formyltetrahydrofolate deformylase
MPSDADPSGLARLLIVCPDRRGLVAEVANFVAGHGGDIVHAEQHTDEREAVFFQRIEFRTDEFDLDPSQLTAAFAPVADRLRMRWQIRYSGTPRPIAILVSKQAHCLYDLLARWRSQELDCDIRMVVSNHPDHRDVAEHFGVGFHHLPVTPATRPAQEAALVELLQSAGVELVVLARYMQVLGPAVLDRFPMGVINIHHSFLPAFVGGRPYHQAYDRGVKLIGATAHYATETLDEGPIIEQDTCRISHRDDVDDLVRKGRDLETVVLARAVRAHIEDRVIVWGNKTVVFT